MPLFCRASKIAAFILIFFACVDSHAQGEIAKYCIEWNRVDSLITIKAIDKDEAVDKINELSKKVSASLPLLDNRSAKVTIKHSFVFPLSRYGTIDSIRFYKDGNDYIGDNYDYFQGSNSIGHPAHDIIIDDKNKDLNDDITGKPVDVVSVSQGIVIAVNVSWQIGSLLRGGKYVKVFDPDENGIYYYSHLSVVSVSPGDRIKEGGKIGEVGRTGRRAVLKEGSTHLHIGFLRLNEGYPEPEEIISKLKDSYSKIKHSKAE